MAVSRDSDIQRLKALQSIVDEADAGLEAAVQKLAALTLKADNSEQLAASLQVQSRSLLVLSHLVLLFASLKLQLTVCQAAVADLEPEQQQLLDKRPLPKQRLDTLATSLSGQSASLSKQLAQARVTQEVTRRCCQHWLG